jgi:chromosome segregation ATPase
MDQSLTPDLSAAISQLGQYYPLTGTQEQGGGSGLAGILGDSEAADYSGELSGIRGLVDKGLGQITTIGQAQSVLGGQINAFSGTLTGVQGQVGGINSQVGDLKNQMTAANTQGAQTKASVDAATAQIGQVNTNVAGMQTGVNTLQSNDAAQTAYMARLGAAIEKIKQGIKV